MIEFEEGPVLRGKRRKCIGVASSAWSAGVGFGRARREPTPAEFEVWDTIHGGKEFRAGLAHGRRMDPKLEQADLFEGGMDGVRA